MTMRLGILQCDSVRPELQPEFGDYPDMFQRLLTTEAVQPEFRVYDLTAGEFPESPMSATRGCSRAANGVSMTRMNGFSGRTNSRASCMRHGGRPSASVSAIN
ncbi:MAG: hypothetical protein U5K33_08665 [Halofilum sp. (in: g-proteobacteria)]|nr:hypothetical protein [Halofilum sp. (in: g-proteobacteria)]